MKPREIILGALIFIAIACTEPANTSTIGSIDNASGVTVTQQNSRANGVAIGVGLVVVAVFVAGYLMGKYSTKK